MAWAVSSWIDYLYYHGWTEVPKINKRWREFGQEIVKPLQRHHLLNKISPHNKEHLN